MREDKKPTVTQEPLHPGDSESETYTHEAFGTITMSNLSRGSGTVLFGSDIEHNQTIMIRVQRAKMRRSLSNDWIHGENLPLVELEMSQAQFAQFITSPNRGEGTPVTLRYATPVGEPSGMSEMASIKRLETKSDMFKREIKQSAKRRLSSFQEQIDKLGTLIECGKLPIKEVREIHKDLKRHSEQLPGSLEFVVDQAQEAFEKAQVTAKIEIEAFINSAVQRIGLSSVQQLIQAVEMAEKGNALKALAES